MMVMTLVMMAMLTVIMVMTVIIMKFIIENSRNNDIIYIEHFWGAGIRPDVRNCVTDC